MRYIREEFIQRMDCELVANERKGDWNTWTPDKDQGMSELQHHVNKLQAAMMAGDRASISEYAADVANISMKISEIHGES